MKRYTFSQLDCHVTSEGMELLKAECAKTGKYDCLILIECLEKSTRLPEDGVDQILPELDGDWLKDGDFCADQAAAARGAPSSCPIPNSNSRRSASRASWRAISQSARICNPSEGSVSSSIF